LVELSGCEEEVVAGETDELAGELSVPETTLFRKKLMRWYRVHARDLPWRGVADPYKTWVSETMLQQTRVAAVIDHYHRFLEKYPALVSLALAPEEDVLAAWSGLGYYRRARLLHKAAQFVVRERGGVFPTTAVELRTLPGIGEYTSAAIASIAFGESVAAVDGNVERVLLRVMGRPESATAAGRTLLRVLANELVPPRTVGTAVAGHGASGWARNGGAKGGRIEEDGAGNGGMRHGRVMSVNAAGDHNQALMELGATVCRPRAPQCGECPLHQLCRTRGEHRTLPRGKLRSKEAAFLLSLRKQGVATEVLLEQRPEEASLMAGMYELPELSLDAANDAMTEREPVLRVRHAITNTNYYVRVYAPTGPEDKVLRRGMTASKDARRWVKTPKLWELPLTGLTKKILERLDVMPVRLPKIAKTEAAEARETEKNTVRVKRKHPERIVDHDEDHDAF
jgi:A/G-specific adenine glycosylase